MSVPKQVFVYCVKCEKVIQKFVEETCEHYKYRTGGRSAAPIAVYFEGPNGEISVPAKGGDRLPPRLAKLGYTVQTVQDAHGYSKLCKKMDREASEKHARVSEAMDRKYGEYQSQQRAELRSLLKTQAGRDFYDIAVQAAQSGYGERFDAGSHIEGFEND